MEMENTSKIKLFEGVGGGLENPHNSGKISTLALSVLRNMARTHRESVKPFKWAAIGAAFVLLVFSKPASAGECWNHVFGVKVLPCSEGPYHVNSGGNGPDMGTMLTSKPTRPARPGEPPKPTEPEDDDCPPEHEGPDDDGNGGPYGGWDTPRGGA